MQAPHLVLDNAGKASKAGFEDGEQAAVSTPPITDVGLTPRKRKHASAAAHARPGTTPTTAAQGMANQKPKFEVASEERPLLPTDADCAVVSAAGCEAKATKGIFTPEMVPYVHAARGAYVAAPAASQRAPAPSLLGPASKPLDVTLQVRLQHIVRMSGRRPRSETFTCQLGHSACSYRDSKQYVLDRSCRILPAYSPAR